MEIPKGKERVKNRRNIWNNDWEFSQINVRYKTTDTESSEHELE